MEQEISIIAAIGWNSVIGKRGDVPWRLNADLERFKTLTFDQTVVVGRKTHESILKKLGHPLDHCRTIVLTRQTGYKTPGCEIAKSWEETRRLITKEKEIFVIGGAEIYQITLPFATNLYLTKVSYTDGGDAFFPNIDLWEWTFTFSESHPSDAENSHAFSFQVFKKLNFQH